MSISAEHSRQLTAADRMRIRIYLNTIATTMTALNFEFGEISHDTWLAETGMEHDHVPQLPRVPYLPTVNAQEGNLSHFLDAVVETLGIGRGGPARQGQQSVPAQDNNEEEVRAQTSDPAEVEKRHQQRGRSACRAYTPQEVSAPRTPAPAPAVEPKSESAGEEASGSGPQRPKSPNYAPSAAASQTKKRQGANSPRWEGFKRRRFSGDNLPSPRPGLPPVWTLEQPPATVASFPTLKGVSSKDSFEEGSEGDSADAFAKWARGSQGPSENVRAAGGGGYGPQRTMFGRAWLDRRRARGEQWWDEEDEKWEEEAEDWEESEDEEEEEEEEDDEAAKNEREEREKKEAEERKEQEKAEKAAAAPQPGPRYHLRPRKRTAADPDDGAKEAKKARSSPSWRL